MSTDKYQDREKTDSRMIDSLRVRTGVRKALFSYTRRKASIAIGLYGVMNRGMKCGEPPAYRDTIRALIFSTVR